MYTVTWHRYPHGIEGECTDCKSKEFSDLDKAVAFLHKRVELIKSINWAGGYIDCDETDMIYEITDDGSVYDKRQIDAKIA